MGQRNLLAFATQQTAGTQYDVIRGSGGAASIDIAGGSANLSLSAIRNQDNLRNASYLESKNKALDLYFGGVSAQKDKIQKEEEARKEIEEFKKRIAAERKAQMKGLLMQIGTTVAMAGLSAAASSFSKGWSATNQASKGTASTLDKLKGGIFGGTMNGETRGGLFNMFNSSGYKDFSVIGAGNVAGLPSSEDLAMWNSKTNSYVNMNPDVFTSKYGVAENLGTLGYDKLGTPVTYGWESPSSSFNFSKLNPMNLFKSSESSGVGKLNMSDMGFGSSISTNSFETTDNTNGVVGMTTDDVEKYIAEQKNLYKKKRLSRAAGGYIPGNGMGDNVPAMLNGGEFVISKQAAQNIGYNNLQKMNSGMSVGSSSEIASRIEIKLEELVEKVAGVGTININIESGKGGSSNEQQEGQGSSQDSRNRDMARKIKDVVLNVLREEKRIGGMLR
jgi:hypothetical protein